MEGKPEYKIGMRMEMQQDDIVTAPKEKKIKPKKKDISSKETKVNVPFFLLKGTIVNSKGEKTTKQLKYIEYMLKTGAYHTYRVIKIDTYKDLEQNKSALLEFSKHDKNVQKLAEILDKNPSDTLKNYIFKEMMIERYGRNYPENSDSSFITDAVILNIYREKLINNIAENAKEGM